MIKFLVTILSLSLFSPVYAADPIGVFLRGGNDVLTSRSLTRDSDIDAGGGADVILTGGGNGRNVSANGGNDRNVDKLYNESLFQFDQDGQGNTLPWVGKHVVQNGHELGFHTYHIGANDQARITTPTQSVPADGISWKMANWHTHGMFIIHGPGFPSLPTHIKSFDWQSQKIAMSTDDDTTNNIHVIAVVGTIVGTDLKVQSFYLKGTTSDPGTNGQYVIVDLNFLNPSQEMRVTISANTLTTTAVETFLKSRGILIGH